MLFVTYKTVSLVIRHICRQSRWQSCLEDIHLARSSSVIHPPRECVRLSWKSCTTIRDGLVGGLTSFQEPGGTIRYTPVCHVVYTSMSIYDVYICPDVPREVTLLATASSKGGSVTLGKSGVSASPNCRSSALSSTSSQSQSQSSLLSPTHSQNASH